MLTQEDQSQFNGTDHNIRSTNRENHKPQTPSCQQPKGRKDGHKRHNVQKLVIFIIYSLIFATLAMVTLITQNYILLPVISTMATELVGELYHAIGASLSSFLGSFIEPENKDDHNT